MGPHDLLECVSTNRIVPSSASVCLVKASDRLLVVFHPRSNGPVAILNGTNSNADVLVGDFPSVVNHLFICFSLFLCLRNTRATSLLA